MINGHSSLREFGGFRLDLDKRLLWSDGEPVALPPKAIDLLCVLVENKGAVVTKDEIFDKVWQNAFVEETNLTHNIYLLRKSFKDLGENEFIKTIPRRGYRFTGDVREIPVSDLVLERHSLTHTTIEIQDGSTDSRTRTKRTLAFSKSKSIFILAAILFAALLGGVSIWRAVNNNSAPMVRTIAVLPLRSAQTANGADHLGLSMADALITRLGSIKSLTIRPISSVAKFENSQADSLQLGKELQVDSILEGTIYRINDRLRINMNLIRVNDGKSLWSGEFERLAGDEFSIEKEVSTKAADALALNLTADEQAALSRDYTANADAYQLYLRGRTEWNKRSWKGMDDAEKYFRSAIEKDPDFALAYVGLADRIVMRADADEAAGLVEHALELDPNLAEAYATRGFYRTFHRWLWAKAESDLRNSIRLKPNYGTAHQWLAILYEIEGKNDDALQEMQRALETDPTSPNFLADLGQTYYFRRDFETAKFYVQKALEIDPEFHFAHDYKMNISLLTGDVSTAVDEWKASAMQGTAFPNISRRQLEELDASLTKRQAHFKNGSMKDFILSLIPPRQNSEPGGYHDGRLYALLGDRDSALVELQKSIDENAFGAVFIKADPFFDSLHDDPRYQAILKRMNL